MQYDITSKMQKYWESDIMERIQSVREEAILASENHISNLKQELRSLIVNYKDSYSNLHEGMVANFNDIDGNVNEIELIASQIKNDSIEPSFQLLKNTLDQMSSVRQEIESIKSN